eukprot:scaffold132_cov170-Amphora_coffeaeformis.AAC.56
MDYTKFCKQGDARLQTVVLFFGRSAISCHITSKQDDESSKNPPTQPSSISISNSTSIETTMEDTPSTPSHSVITQDATKGSTWYSYYSKEHDREYYHEPVSGMVSWVAPTCGPAGAPIIHVGEEEEDSHNTPPPMPEEDGVALKICSPPRSLQVKLAYWAAAVLVCNLLLMFWTHSSLRNVIRLSETPAVITMSHESRPCEPCPAVQAAKCEAVACEPVDCQPVACDPVPCEAVDCETSPCKPVACEPVACEPVACEPTIEYRYLPNAANPDLDSEGQTELNEYVQHALEQNLKTFDEVWEHIQKSMPESINDTGSQDAMLPKICKIPLAKRVVPECRNEPTTMRMDGSSGTDGMMK